MDKNQFYKRKSVKWKQITLVDLIINGLSVMKIDKTYNVWYTDAMFTSNMYIYIVRFCVQMT